MVIDTNNPNYRIMKRMNYLAMVLALALSMPATDMVAQHTGYRGGTTTGNPGGGRRPDSNPQRQPGNNRHDRPDNKHHDRPGNDRYDRPGNDRYDRPGNDRYDRPGNDRYDRPNSSHHGHPGNPGNPWHPGRPGNPGSTNHHHGFHPTPPPPRPYRPIVRPAPRPVPPPAFRPCPTAPMLTAVFGLPFGISINISIDNLRRDGYYIDGYNNNEVYLRNVYEMNYSWDDGVVIYDSSGRMQSARLYQSTYGYDSSRFDNLYSQICSQYGLPATQKYRNGEKTVTWYDRNGSHYVSLAYNHMTSDGGYPRYYTILCYGI